MKKAFALAVAISLLFLGMASCKQKGIQDRLKDAQQAFDRGELPAAVTEANKILEKYPSDPEAFKAHILLANAYASLKNFDQSRQHLQEVVDKVGLKDINGQMALAMKIRLFAAEERFDAATTETLKGLQAAEKGTAFYQHLQLGLGHFYDATGKVDKAREVYEDIVRTVKDENIAVQALDMLTGSYARSEDFGKAVKLYEDYLAQHPETRFKQSLLIGIGYYYEKKGDKKHAEQYYTQGIKGYEEAIEKTLNVEEKAQLMTQLARAHELKGENDKARQIKEKIVSDYSQTSSAAMAAMELALVSTSDRDFDRALELLKLVEDKHPQFAKEYDVAGRIAMIKRVKSQMESTSPTLTKTKQ
jgi:tetratricopeptide (TPR) repeat protein